MQRREEVGSQSALSCIDRKVALVGTFGKSACPLRGDGTITHRRSSDDTGGLKRILSLFAEANREFLLHFVKFIDEIGVLEEYLLIGIGLGGRKGEVGTFVTGNPVDPLELFKRIIVGFITKILPHRATQQVKEVAHSANQRIIDKQLIFSLDISVVDRHREQYDHDNDKKEFTYDPPIIADQVNVVKKILLIHDSLSLSPKKR